MRIYVQSKSGNFNAVLEVTPPLSTLSESFTQLRQQGGYQVKHKKSGEDYVIPFEEIQFIRWAREGEGE